jgi:sugar phosphate isomerase/epimerase
MANGPIRFSVFTKPWTLPIPELGAHVHALGFDGIELPVRPGYPVTPDNVEDLKKAVAELRAHDIEVYSIAGPTDERTIAACAEAGVPIIRICPSIGEDGYMASENRLQKEFDALVPALDASGVTIGFQNHCGNSFTSAIGVMHLIEKYDPRHVGIVWDVAHCGLQGEAPNLAIDIAWSHLCMVNFKNAFWQRTNGPEAPYAEWAWYWTSGRHGIAPWPQAADELKKRGYEGVVCLTAEYSDHGAVDRLIAEDIDFAKGLFA